MAWARLPRASGAIVYRSLSYNLSLLKPSLCTSVFYSSAMTLRRGSFLAAEIFHHWYLFRSSWLPTIWQLGINYSYCPAWPTGCQSLPPLRGVLSHITTAAVSYYRDWTPTSLIIIGPTLTMRMATDTSCTVSYSCFAYLSESWSDSHGCMDDRIWVIVHYIFRSAALN